MCIRDRYGILELDESTYDRLLAAPRDFSVTVLYTALHPRYRCAACNLFKEPYEQVSLGWQKKKSTRRHVFAKVEADRAMEVLKRVRGATHRRISLRTSL